MDFLFLGVKLPIYILVNLVVISIFHQENFIPTAPSRRGDLEILGYCMLQWVCGKLPWENNLTNPTYVAECKEGCVSQWHDGTFLFFF